MIICTYLYITFIIFINQLSTRENNLIVIDSRNHGRSLVNGPLKVDYEAMATDIIDTFDFLNIKDAHLIGIKMRSSKFMSIKIIFLNI